MSCELPHFQSDDGSRFGFPNVERVAARASEVLPDPFRGKTNARRLWEKMFGTHAVSSSRDINAEGLHDWTTHVFCNNSWWRSQFRTAPIPTVTPFRRTRRTKSSTTGLRMCNQLAQNHNGMGITREFFCGLGPHVGFPLAVLLFENALVLLGKSVIPPIFVYNCERRAIASIGAEPFVLNLCKRVASRSSVKAFSDRKISSAFWDSFFIGCPDVFYMVNVNHLLNYLSQLISGNS